MTWTAPKTWDVGEVLTAAEMNTQLRDNLIDLNARDRIKVYTTSDIALPDQTWTQITWHAATDYTNLAMWPSGSEPTRIAPLAAGFYMGVLNVSTYQASGSGAENVGSRAVRIEKNSEGTEASAKAISRVFEAAAPTLSNGSAYCLPCLFSADGASDSIECWVWQNSGVAQKIGRAHV